MTPPANERLNQPPGEDLPPPPRAATQWLTAALATDPSGDAILGDLNEDFHRVHAARGLAVARRWYWRQSVGLAVSVRLHRFLRPVTDRRLELRAMIEALSPKGLLADLQYAARALRRDLGFALFATLVTGLGIGATTAVFSVMSPLLIEPLPFQDPERLVWIAKDVEGGRSSVTSRTSNLRDFRELSTSLERIAGFNAFFEQETYNLTGRGEPERLAGVGVTHDFLDVLGVEPMLGRNFTEAEGRRWDDSAILLSHGLWRNRFEADPDIVGRALTLNGAPSTVIGVLPQSFDFSSAFTPNSRVDLITTFPVNDDTDRWGNTISIIGRLAPEASLGTARAEIDSILTRLRTEDPDRWGLEAQLVPLRAQISGGHRSALLLLFGAATAVMLIVCVNLASLLLSKGVRRRQEMTLRAAIGAPRGRLLRQLLLESLMLSAGGALVGIGLAVWITNLVAGSSAVSIPLLASVRVDAGALGFSCGVAVLSGLAVGLLPALQASGDSAATALREGGRSSSGGLQSRWLRETLVVAEVALACTLLIVGGLLLRSFSRVLDVDLGFQPAERAAWLVNTDREFEDLDARVSFYRALSDEVLHVPGVESVGLTDAIPLGINREWTLGVPGRTFERGESPQVFPHVVDRGYLEVMGIPLVDGRGFLESDRADVERVALLNESASRHLFPERGAVGRVVSVGDTELTVVGVVADVRHLALERSSGYELYLPISQTGDFDTLDLVVRSTQPLDSLRASVAAAIHRIDPNMPTNDVRTLESVVDRSLSPRRFSLGLLSAFALTALLLAALGIYGVLSYTVSERSREIGIRMALGESVFRVRSRVLGRTLLLAAGGALLGTGAALALSRLVASLLFGIEPDNPAILALTPLTLLVVAAASAWLPARRASRIDALQSLRTN